MLKVKDHKEFACFDYKSNKCDNPYPLGAVVIRHNEDGTEIGVVLQIHDENELRTDMFGNASLSEISPATKKEVMEFRPTLINKI